MVEKTYEDYSGIEEYPNAFDKDFCQEVIRHFETLDDNRVINANRQGHGFVTDDRIVFDWAHTQGVYHYDYKICDYFYEKLKEIYTNEYMQKYSILQHSKQHSAKGMNVQRTSPHQGYHAWHAEAACKSSACRVVNYMVYLNNVEEGGETEFLYQGKRIAPEEGKLVIFPTAFTHPHRGNPIYKGLKYIITGWYTYDE